MSIFYELVNEKGYYSKLEPNSYYVTGIKEFDDDYYFDKI